MLRQMSQMVAESSALKVRRDKDWCRVVVRRRLLVCLLILAHAFLITSVYRRALRLPHVAAQSGAPTQHVASITALTTPGGVFRTEVPGVGTLQCDSSLGLKLK